MYYPIKFLLLQKSELIYEVLIRGDVPAENVLELRRQITKLTAKYPSEDIFESCLDFNEDANGIMETLQKIKTNVDNLTSDCQRSLFDRTQTLVNHLHFRIQRIVNPESADQVKTLTYIKKTYNSFSSQMSALASKLNTTTPQNTTESSSINKPDTNNDVVTKISVSCDRGLSSDLTKLKYDGSSCVRSFIQRLEEFRLSREISDSKMLNILTDIFTGNALHWYRTVRERVATWNDLLSLLKQDFDIIDYDYRMLSEIRHRTQGTTENITIYLAIMNGMFSRLSSPLTEQDKLEIVLHNIRPCYANILATCPSIENLNQLQSICRNYESIKLRCENFKEPPALGPCTLAPEFAYHSSRASTRSKNEFSFNSSAPSSSYSNNQANNFYKQQTSNKTFTIAAHSKPKYCYRCKAQTHAMKDCNAERTVFCFKCGLPDYRTPECPKCNPKQSETKN